MADRAWKATERAIAARLGGRRVPITGRQRGDVPDVAHPAFAMRLADFEDWNGPLGQEGGDQ